MKILNTYVKSISVIFLLFILKYPVEIFAQVDQKSNYNPDSLISAAKELMLDTRYCALITLDDNGHPQARTMDPFPPDTNMIVWFGTNSNSRKVKEINNNSKVTLYYEASDARGYVVLKGNAFIVNDSDRKLKYWKPEWEIFYPESKENYTLIKFIPNKLEIVDYKHNIVGDSITWRVPNLDIN